VEVFAQVGALAVTERQGLKGSLPNGTTASRDRFVDGSTEVEEKAERCAVDGSKAEDVWSLSEMSAEVGVVFSPDSKRASRSSSAWVLSSKAYAKACSSLYWQPASFPAVLQVVQHGRIASHFWS
jgi:hypothetical protein